MTFQSVNPYTEELIGELKFLSGAQLANSLDRAERALRSWRTESFSVRSNLFLRLQDLLLKKRESLAQLISTEMGKVISEARSEVDKCALSTRYFAEHGADYLMSAEFSHSGLSGQARVEYAPLGIILGIMPWNFPFWQVFRFAIPALSCGNVLVVKHAPNTGLCAEAIAELFLEAGFDPGVYQNIPVPVPMVEDLIKDRRVAGVSLTGSTRAGREVASLAGRHLKKSVLELGGSDPYLVLEDADLQLAAKKCLASRLQNCGQSCVAAKRWIIHSRVFPEFISCLEELLLHHCLGDPLDPEVTLGPLARRDLVEQMKAQVDRSLELGGKLLYELKAPKAHGFFHPVQIIHCRHRQDPLLVEESFGPVAGIWVTESESEMLEIANSSPYGLGAAIFTQSENKAQFIGRRLEAGMVFVNDMVRSMPELPFGGVKDSGYGRELSMFGVHEFANIKTMFYS